MPYTAESLCWKCARAYPGNGCQWADKFRPVDGWTAEPTLKCSRAGAAPIRSYHVTECPKFVRDMRKSCPITCDTKPHRKSNFKLHK